MNTGFFTASTGTVQLQKGIDVVANNIANISTAGYKSSTTSFADLLHTKMKGTSPNLTVGHGARLEKTDIMFSQGSLRPTGRALDYAIISDNGFFGIVDGNGEVSFTRDGNFCLSDNQDGTFTLASGRGGYVVDENMNKIIIADTAKIDEQELNVGTFTFENRDGLLLSEQGNYLVTQKSGEPTAEYVDTKRFYLEESTVNLPTEIANSIQIQRAFQMNAKMVQISDEVEQTINSLR